jgi:hypothetical protein
LGLDVVGAGAVAVAVFVSLPLWPGSAVATSVRPLPQLDFATDVSGRTVGPAKLRSRNGGRIVEAIPPNRTLTETDGPDTKIGAGHPNPVRFPRSSLR